MNTKELANICGVSIPTITENAKKVGIILEKGKSHDYTEDEIKKIQAQLMKNGFNRGNATTKEKIVEEQVLNAFKGGISLQVIMQSGNIEAAKEICQLITEGTKAQHDLKLEQQHNHQLQLEVKQLHEDLYNKDSEIDYLKKLTDFQSTQLGYYTKKYHSWYDNYENY